jgi:UDP-3-O-[3-hydroxymyristoyl] glucosamine N-acyltransferase
VSELASVVSGVVVGQGQHIITQVAALSSAGPAAVSFCESAMQAQLQVTQAGVILVQDALHDACPLHAIIVDQPRLAFAKLLNTVFPKTRPDAGISDTAIIENTCQIDRTASIGPGCVLGSECVVESGVVLEAGCVLGSGVRVGRDTHLFPRITLYSNTELGQRCEVHSGAVIGKPGFGFVLDDQKHWQCVPQIGRVRLGNDVVIGANTTIDCGALNDTIISDGVKCDNQVQIGHNVVVGAHTLICGCVGIGGSVEIGPHCVIGGQSGIADHIKIAENVVLAGSSGVGQDILVSGVYGGDPAQPIMQWKRSCVHIAQLNRWAQRIRALELNCE